MKTGTFYYIAYGKQHSLPVRDCPNVLVAKQMLEGLTGDVVTWRESPHR